MIVHDDPCIQLVSGNMTMTNVFAGNQITGAIEWKMHWGVDSCLTKRYVEVSK